MLNRNVLFLQHCIFVFKLLQFDRCFVEIREETICSFEIVGNGNQ